MSTGISRRAMLSAIGIAGVIAGAVTAGRQVASKRPLALVDADMDQMSLRAARALFPGTRTQMLQSDLVWQWRRDLGRKLAKGRSATAIVRWDKAMVLTGLAREAGLKVSQEQIARSMFRVEIG